MVEYRTVVSYKKPTKRDAELYLQLMRTQSTPEMNEAFTWFTKGFTAKDYKEFKAKYPEGSPEHNNLSRILSVFELDGALVSHGLLNENLYFDMSGIGFMWERLAPVVAGWRKEVSPVLWENAVWLAERQKQWSKEVWKPGLKWKKK